MTHTVKGFSIVNEAELIFFRNFLAFFMIQWILAIWSLVSLSTKSSLYIWQFSVHVLLKPGLKDFEYNFASMWSEWNYTVVWTCFGIAFLWDWNENWLFPGHCWVFQICWHTEWSTLTASCFRNLNSLTGFPPPPRALFVVMLLKDHLSSHSKTSGPRWVSTLSWLSRSLRPFCRILLCALATSLISKNVETHHLA